jgi:hypothetical protein
MRDCPDPDVLKGKKPWEASRALEPRGIATEARDERDGETL